MNNECIALTVDHRCILVTEADNLKGVLNNHRDEVWLSVSEIDQPFNQTAPSFSAFLRTFPSNPGSISPLSRRISN
jgi:hypothetical protein